METIYERCCGLDIHKQSVTACLITPNGKAIRTFGTMTADLLELSDWLLSDGCTQVAMESTGVYWKPIYNLLESSGLELLLVNAAHMKAVPGRKTDVQDAEWIADLLRHGLLRGSYVPDRGQRELRELVRYRKSLVEERSREVNRIQKMLEGANIKLGDVASDVLGKSGRAMLEKIVAGETDPDTLADLAKGKLREKRTELVRALQGLIGAHQQRLLASQLRHIDFLDEEIARLSQDIEERMDPLEGALQALDDLPGVGRRNAEQILAQTGMDMSRFPTDAHIASWAGVCPGNNESAGKRKSGRTRLGNPVLRRDLVEAAIAACRTKNTYLSAQYHRIAARRGSKRAIVAIAHTILITIYHMLKDGTPYTDLGPDYFEKRNRDSITRQAIQRLEGLGYKVSLEAA